MGGITSTRLRDTTKSSHHNERTRKGAKSCCYRRERGDYAIYKIKMNSDLDANSVLKALLFLERDWGLDFEKTIILYEEKAPHAELFVAEKIIEKSI